MLAKIVSKRCRLLRSPNRIFSGSLRRYLPNHFISAKVILDEEALWVDRKHHLTLLAEGVSLRDLQRPLDALSLRRHLEPSGAAPNLYGDPYHVLLLSYWPVKKCMAGGEASASARWLAFRRSCSQFFGLNTVLSSEKADNPKFAESPSETVWKIGTGPESSPRRPPGGPKGSRSAASWRQKPTLERPPAIFQTVSPRTPPVNKASLSVGLLPSATNRALVCVAHLHGAAIKANPPKSGDAKPRASNRTEGSRATEHRGQDAFSYLWAAQGGSDHPDDLHRLSDGRTL